MNFNRTLKTYLIKAIHKWCTDFDLTPYITVCVNQNCILPKQFQNTDKITLNISYNSTRDLDFSKDLISFKTRFSGLSYDIVIPVANVIAAFAKETGDGLPFNFDESYQEPKQEVVENNEQEKSNNIVFVPAIRRSRKRRQQLASQLENQTKDLQHPKDEEI